MIPLKLINTQLNAFAAYVKIARLRHGYSLRELAKHTNLSHTFLNRIEHASTSLTEESYRKIYKAFNQKLTYSIEHESYLEQQKHRFHDALFYNDDELVESIHEQLKKHEDYYMNSLDIIDYLLCMQGFAYMRNVQFQEHVTLYDEYLLSIQGRLSKTQEAMFFMYRGLSRYSYGERSESLNDLLNAIEITTDRKILALSSIIIGRIYSDQYNLYKAEQYLSQARYLYDTFNHFMTSVFIQTYQAINQLKLHRFEGLEETFENLLEYENHPKFEPIKRTIIIHYLLFMLLHGKFESVLSISEYSKDDLQHRFYYALAAHHLKVTLNQNDYQNILTKKVRKELLIYQYGLDFILDLNLRQTIDDKLFDKVKLFFDQAIEEKHYLEAQLGFPYMVNYYIDSRQYKKAHQLNLTMMYLMSGEKEL